MNKVQFQKVCEDCRGMECLEGWRYLGHKVRRKMNKTYQNHFLSINAEISTNWNIVMKFTKPLAGLKVSHGQMNTIDMTKFEVIL